MASNQDSVMNDTPNSVDDIVHRYRNLRVRELVKPPDLPGWAQEMLATTLPAEIRGYIDDLGQYCRSVLWAIVHILTVTWQVRALLGLGSSYSGLAS